MANQLFLAGDRAHFVLLDGRAASYGRDGTPILKIVVRGPVRREWLRKTNIVLARWLQGRLPEERLLRSTYVLLGDEGFDFPSGALELKLGGVGDGDEGRVLAHVAQAYWTSFR